MMYRAAIYSANRPKAKINSKTAISRNRIKNIGNSVIVVFPLINYYAA